jgi:drug/metabolite transporter (DMT)-like permease
VSSKPDTTKLWSFLFAVYIIWGSTYLGMKIATEVVPPFLLSAFRFLVAGTLMALISTAFPETGIVCCLCRFDADRDR